MGKPLTAWSFSRWSKYDTCPQQLKFSAIDKHPEPESPALANGAQVHDVLAAYCRGDLPPNDPVPGWTYFADLLKQLRSMDPLVEQEWGYNRTWGPTGWYGNDTWFRSKLDAALIYDSEADVVDFKTGKPRFKDAGEQAELYFLSIVKRYRNVRAVTVRFWYLDVGVEMPESDREKVFRFSVDMAPDLMAKWTKRAERMLSDKIMPPKPGQHCRWCAFAKSSGGPCKYG